ncbi:HNH endonuclease signature motif containing protein [Gryllotalpicola koreensis]|uniref:HNH nuclease domain-containing protein n=1 Tax=Gryllotalpicola koreensis TaxID=993086 RepID=A0ABP8A6P9_9MICO
MNRGPGAVELVTPAPRWGGRKAQEYVQLTLQTYGTVCWLCGLPGATSADHVIPRSKGGAVYNLDNLGPAHERCNESRGNRPADTYQLIEDGLAWFSVA